MDIEGGRRRKPKVNIGSDDLSEQYPLDLQMYLLPPVTDITLTEFEDVALDRLQFLRIFERAIQKGHKPYTSEWKECIRVDTKKENLHGYSRLIRAGGTTGITDADLQARRADHISHFIMGLAYCRSDELRRWFLTREMELFRFRFTEMSPENVRMFLNINHLDYTPITEEEKNAILPQLICSTIGYNESRIEIMDFYKISFTQVCNLVKTRKVFLKNGFAYIPSTELSSCISTIFRAHLNERLAKMHKWLPNIGDERLNNLLSNIHTSYTGNDYSVSHLQKTGIDISNMDSYAKQNFPICMRSIHNIFRSTHHLKHGCRLQYGLFIKGIGVSFEDAMKYFRDEFTKILDGNTFEKKYSYNIKHQYGKAGSMTNYSPHSCIKIITSTVGPGEFHGCPFKHWDGHVLRHKLSEYGVSTEGIADIVDLASKGHFQVACGKYFEYTHGQESKNAINHPNQYFEDSFTLRNEKPPPSSSFNRFGSKSKAPRTDYADITEIE